MFQNGMVTFSADRLLNRSEKRRSCGGLRPSGSGKSTLIKTVNGLEPVQQVKSPSMASWLTTRKPIWRNSFPRRDGVSAFRAVPPSVDYENLTLAQVKVLKRNKAPAREKH